jgi:NAD(P)-dependent dehydrogenase (short-subunit alcohol dehydrogenase family)
MRVVLVTGTGQEIGRSIADGLSEIGYAVVAETGATVEADDEKRATAALVREIVRRGGRAVAGHHDLTTGAGARSCVELAVETFGALDVLVACGALERERSLARIEESAWSTLTSRHLTASFLGCQSAARWMMDRGRPGRLICITGVASSGFGRTHLAAVAAGVSGFVRAMAIELRPKGITVNALTPAVAVKAASQAELSRVHAQPQAPSYQVEGIVPVTSFLASEAAAEITGQVVALNGRKLSVVRSVESTGAVAADGDWSVEEIARRWSELSR